MFALLSNNTMNTQNQWKEKWANQPMLMLTTVVIWSVFIGLCIKAGALTFVAILSFFNAPVAQDLYEGLNLYSLMQENLWYYVGLLSLIIGIAVSKAYLFYLMIRIFMSIDLQHPFNSKVGNYLSQMGSTALQIGFLIIITSSSIKWLIKRGFEIPSMAGFIGGAMEFIFMGILIFAIAQVFKRGIEIQSENELTV
ncbi:DUF2975 domain-containing protein [Mongoliitalea lutea]|uniref:DUF2975 domain-containing protein n=2 Tax=Mongoliitalea lutea TaxID=849756 RepID=A0A8J3CUN5_9BACT|nr:hypothetical protein GCM10008106_04100 [Mongoliitalea lutea]